MGDGSAPVVGLPGVSDVRDGVGDGDAVDAVSGVSVAELGAGLLQPPKVTVRRAAAPHRRTIIRAG